MSADDYKYWAFISYSHRNVDWAKWLQRALERYRVPRRLVGQAGADGPLPRRLYPVFRDQEELSSGSSLSTAIDQALVASRYLIVIASPHAAVSHWVEKEIQRFRALGRGDRILCLIVDGDPQVEGNAAPNTLQCMPPSLRRQVDVHDDYEPIAADVRPGGETRDAAKIRLIAGLLGVGFDDLRRRDQRRRRWLISAWTAASVVLLALLALFGHHQRVMREEALAQQAQSIHLRLVMEKARDEMLEFHPARAAVYLAEAYRLGVDTRVLRYWLGRSMEYVDARLQVMDTGAPVQLIRFGHTPDTLLSMGENNHIQLWDVASGQRRIDIDAGGKRTFCQLSADDRYVACTMGEDFDHLRAWDTSTGRMQMDVAMQIRGTASNLFSARRPVLAVIAPDHHPELHDASDPTKILRLPIEAAAISFDRGGGQLLVGTESGDISIWDTETGHQLRHFAKMDAPVNWLDAPRDGSRIGASDSHGGLRIWDVATGRIRLSAGHAGIQVNIHFDEAGKNLFSEGSDGARVWDTESGALKFALKTNVGNSVESQLSPDGHLIYSSGVGEARAYLVDAGIQTYAVDGHRYPTNDMVFSPDGQLFATSSTDGRVIVWRLPKQPLFEFPHGPAHPATFANELIAGGVGIYSHNGRMIATASTDGAVRVWDAGTHGLIKAFENVDPVAVDVLAFNDDDQILAAGGDNGGIQLWSMPDGKPLRKLDTGEAGPLWMKFSGDRLAAAWTGHQSGIWRVADGEQIGAWSRDGGGAQALSPDGQTFVVGSEGSLTARRTADASELWTVKPAAGDEIAAVAYSRNSAILAMADNAHQLMTLDAATGKPLAHLQIPAGVQTYGIAVSDDGHVVAEADSNRDALLWWPATQRVVKLQGHAGVVMSVAFSPDQRLVLTTSKDATARLWDANTGERVEVVAGQAQTFGTAPFVGAHFSPDGSKVLTASIDGEVGEWSVPNENRDPETISAAVRCSAPWQLEGETLIAVLPSAQRCEGSRR